MSSADTVSPGRRWLWPMILVAATYALVGIVSGALAGRAASHQMRVLWRWVAFVASGVVFAAHIAYERFRLRTAPAMTAWHASLAAAVGAFALAAAANVHEHFTASSHRGSLIASLAIWPVLVGVPAFLVAWAVAAGLSSRRASR